MCYRARALTSGDLKFNLWGLRATLCMNWKHALLAAPPLLGLLCIWNIGHRNERLLVGRWQTGVASDEPGALLNTTRFRADGTYEKIGWRKVYDPSQPFTPGTPVFWGRVRSWGRYSFVDRDRVVMEGLGEEAEGKVPPPPPSPRGFLICGTGSMGTPDDEPILPGLRIELQGDQARVTSRGEEAANWNRLQEEPPRRAPLLRLHSAGPQELEADDEAGEAR